MPNVLTKASKLTCAHQGTIQVESKLNAGTTFLLQFPIQN